MWKIKATVIDKTVFSGGYVRLRIHAPEIAGAARPGQFLNVLTGEDSAPFLRRPIGIENVDEAWGVVSMLVKVVGRGTRRLADLVADKTLDIIGPLGNGFNLEAVGAPTLLVAGGIGVAPFLHYAHYAANRGFASQLVLFFGGRTRDDLVSLPDFEGLVSDTYAATEDGSFGAAGLVTDSLSARLDEWGPEGWRIYCCGPVRMMKAVADISFARSIPCFVSLETVMGCGLGSCMGCVAQTKGDGGVRYLRACTEGPIFDAATLTWEGML